MSFSSNDEKPDEKPEFTLLRFNPRRKARGVVATEVKAVFPDGEVYILWMSELDVIKNGVKYGDCPELAKARKAYRENKDYHRGREVPTS